MGYEPFFVVLRLFLSRLDKEKDFISLHFHLFVQYYVWHSIC